MARERLAKINELIRRELGEIIQEEFEHSSREFITITEVETSQDILHTRVKVSIWPEESAKKLFFGLQKAAGFFQSLLNKKLQMYPVPRITFELDKRVGEAGRVEEVLEDIKNSAN